MDTDNYVGRHVFFDFDNFDVGEESPSETGGEIFNIMINAITQKSNMKIVHQHIEILQQPQTEDGFTCILLLDASHFTAHAYTSKNKKLLAMDLFTCGPTDTEKLANYTIHMIQEKYKGVNINRHQIERRFKY